MRKITNLKLVVGRVSTLDNPLVLESASDSKTDYLKEEFTDALDEDNAKQGGNDEDRGDESAGDHGVGDQEDYDEEEVERVELEGLEYE